MPTTEIIWRTRAGDLMGVLVDSPEAGDDRVRVAIGSRNFLRLPRVEARLLAQALLDAANSPEQLVHRPPLPIPQPAPLPPAALYHEPEEETCLNLPAA